MRPQSKFLLQIYTIKANHGRRTERSTLIMEEHLRILEFCLVHLENFLQVHGILLFMLDW